MHPSIKILLDVKDYLVQYPIKADPILIHEGGIPQIFGSSINIMMGSEESEIYGNNRLLTKVKITLEINSAQSIYSENKLKLLSDLSEQIDSAFLDVQAEKVSTKAMNIELDSGFTIDTINHSDFQHSKMIKNYIFTYKRSILDAEVI